MRTLNKLPIPNISSVKVLVAYSAIAVFFTWPLILHLSDYVIGPFLADNLEYVWKLWWVKHAVLDLKVSPWLQPDIYYPYGYNLAFGEMTPIHTFLGIPITAIIGAVPTYNLFIILSSILTGFFTYFLGLEIGFGRKAAFLAGVIFAFSPYRSARITGHLPLVDTQWFPLALLFLERLRKNPKRSISVYFGLAVAAIFLSSWYYGVIFAGLLPIWLLASKRMRLPEFRALVNTGWPAVVVWGVLVVPFLIPYLKLDELGLVHVSLNQAIFWSASATDYLLPNPLNFLWGDWVEQRLTFFPDGLPYEFILSIGFVPFLLAFYGWRKGEKESTRAWVWVAVVGFILSLGPVLKIMGIVVTVNAPDWVSGLLSGLMASDKFQDLESLVLPNRMPLPLPALLLRYFVPGLIGMRAWARFSVMVMFAVAMLAAVGFEVAMKENRINQEKNTKTDMKLFLILLFLIILEFFSGTRDLVKIEPRPVDQWLATQPEKAIIIEMPLPFALSGPQMLFTSFHNQYYAAGYGTYLPIIFSQRYPDLEDFPSDEAIDILNNWGADAGLVPPGIQYILVDEMNVAPENNLWVRILNQPRLVLTKVIGSTRIYTIR